MNVRIFLAVLLTASIAACTASGTIGSPSPQATAQLTLQGVESAYQAAATAELVYLNLPTCGTPAATTALCATAERRAQIKAFDNQAYAAIVAARTAADTATPGAAAALSSASHAVTNLTNAIPK